jgi:hypothetical protein
MSNSDFAFGIDIRGVKESAELELTTLIINSSVVDTLAQRLLDFARNMGETAGLVAGYRTGYQTGAEMVLGYFDGGEEGISMQKVQPLNLAQTQGEYLSAIAKEARADNLEELAFDIGYR